MSADARLVLTGLDADGTLHSGNDPIHGVWIDQKKARALTGWSESTVKRYFKKRESFLRAEKKNGWVKTYLPAHLLPEPARAKLIGHSAPETTEAANEATWSDWQRAEVNRRVAIVEAWRQCAAHVEGDLTAARTDFADDCGISLGTLYRWDKAYGPSCRRVALLPKWGSRDKFSRLSDGDREYLLNLYLDPRAPHRTVQMVYDSWTLNLARVSRHEGRKPAKAPSYSTVNNFLKQPTVKILKFAAVHGTRKAMEKFGPYVTRTRSEAYRGLAYVGDHHQIDKPVISKDRKRVVFPWITAWLDYATTMCVGYHLSESPNTDTIKLALREALRWGVPDIVHVDNGKDYRAKFFEGGRVKENRKYRVAADETELKGIYAQLLVKIVHANPYNARSKIIERWFQIFTKRMTPGLSGHRGTSFDQRPEYAEKLRKKTLAAIEAGEPLGSDHGTAMTWEEFEDIVAHTVRWANEVRETKAEGVKGATAWEAWSNDDHPLRAADPGSIWCLFLADDSRVVTKSGVKFLHRRYENTALAKFEGQQVRVRYEPANLRSILVHELAGDRLICVAETVKPIDAFDRTATTAGIAEGKRRERAWKSAVDFEKIARAKHAEFTLSQALGIPEPGEMPPAATPPSADVVELNPLTIPARRARDEIERRLAANAPAPDPAPGAVSLLDDLPMPVKRSASWQDEEPLWNDIRVQNPKESDDE